MSAYRLEDERAIRTGRRVDDWTHSGLLTAEQRDIVRPQLAVDLRRTNQFLRIMLFLFGGMILQSALGLVAVFIGALADETSAVLCMAAGGTGFWLASRLVSRYGLYRFGVEEAVALSAVGLTAVGAALLVADSGNWPLVVGLVVAAAMFTALSLHFGYVYGAVFAMVAAAALPFQFGDSQVMQRAIAVVVLGTIAAAARTARAEHGDEYPGDALTIIEAAAWVGIYLLVNLVVSSGITPLDRASAFHWFTYAAIWVLPAVGLWLALRGRERPLLWASLAMALATLLSTQEYLGSPRHAWDPILLGLLLMGIAIAVRRWLAAGDDGARHGYTAARLMASDKARIGSLAMVSAIHTDVPIAPSDSVVDSSIGGGGRSGGAGAGGSF